MPKCTKCDELFSVEDGEYNDDKEFMCAMCAVDFKDDVLEDEDELDLDEEDEDEKGEKAEVKPKACPSCKEKSVDYAESGICPDCGYEKDVK